MGGFQLNGCGAKDYFTKVKYLGDKVCPKCGKLASFYLSKGKFKVSVFWVPTVTLKERYAVMCEKCQEGYWIDNSEAYKILSSSSFDLNSLKGESISKTSNRTCSNCGAEVDGDFCGMCGTKYTEPVAVQSRRCSNCGAEVDGAFCSVCGTKYAEPQSQPEKKCPKCGATVTGKFCAYCGTKYTEGEVAQPEKRLCSVCSSEVVGEFCGFCGTRYGESKDSSNISETDNNSFGVSGEETVMNNGDIKNEEPSNTAVSNTWECSLCGTNNLLTADKCSLCGSSKE